ncbi:GGDEF domain-containing phosphodiesterase [Ideonella livida]|uniref:EAL domain-containing protein n=1 Tax=Ideonella livida TaxID=2707176 RepID=A0A7C9PID7_9BURK|nr:EAL domain-containing protein [Ideonella livida]NDY91932.1 EAL domain-containing protein [Ideonella livida]
MLPREPGLQALVEASRTAPAPCWLAQLEEPAWLVDPSSGLVLQSNAAAQDWHALLRPGGGAVRADLLGGLEDVHFWAELTQPAPALAGADLPLPTLCSETEWPGPQGEPRWVERHIRPVTLEDGRTVMWVRLQDRTAQRRWLQERDQALAELRATLEATPDGLLVTNAQGAVQALNHRFALLWGLPFASHDSPAARADDGRLWAWMAQSALQPQALLARLTQLRGQWLGRTEDRFALRDGRWLECRTEPQWGRGLVQGRVWVWREARPNAGWRAAGRTLAAPNPTEGLSEADWREALEAALDAADAQGSDLAVCCLGLEAEALYAQGEQAGAATLARLRGTVGREAGPTARVAVLGPDQLGVLLPGAGAGQARELAARLLPRCGPEGADAPAASLGVALYPEAGVSADRLWPLARQAQARAADRARAGLSAWVLEGEAPATPVRTVRAGMRRLERLEVLLRSAAAERELLLHYQPLVDLPTGRVAGAEVLLRWHDPDQGMLAPALFLPQARRAGLMPALDDWVLEQALRQACAWRQGGRPLLLNVNLSVPTLDDPGLPRRLAALLKASGWPPDQLALDVPEAALACDVESAVVRLQALHRLGVRLVLDDYGAGQVPLAALRRLPLAAVKLDPQLVRTLGPQPPGGWTGALLDVARHMRWPLWAEGVETLAQREQLGRLGCQQAQGHLWAPALRPEPWLRHAAAAEDRRMPPGLGLVPAATS